jgi:hypothetical protein
MAVITLEDSEQRIAEWVAKSRRAQNRKAGIAEPDLGGKQSPEFREINGMGGELAFCKAFNLYPDLVVADVGPRFDTSFCGMKSDIKTTEYKNGRLLVPVKNKDYDIEMYALVTGTAPSFTIVGWALRDEVIDQQNIIDLGYGDVYSLDGGDLHPFSPYLYRGNHG